MTSQALSAEACENCGAMIPGGREIDRLRAELERLREFMKIGMLCLPQPTPAEPNRALVVNEEHADDLVFRDKLVVRFPDVPYATYRAALLATTETPPS